MDLLSFADPAFFSYHSKQISREISFEGLEPLDLMAFHFAGASLVPQKPAALPELDNGDNGSRYASEDLPFGVPTMFPRFPYNAFMDSTVSSSSMEPAVDVTSVQPAQPFSVAFTSTAALPPCPPMPAFPRTRLLATTAAATTQPPQRYTAAVAETRRVRAGKAAPAVSSPSTPASSKSAPLRCTGNDKSLLDAKWSEQMLTMPTSELNRLLKTTPMSRADIKLLRESRRRRKNRLYARKSRSLRAANHSPSSHTDDDDNDAEEEDEDEDHESGSQSSVSPAQPFAPDHGYNSIGLRRELQYASPPW